eukprot:NODE_1675_length_1087_cov_200.405039.p2 GENE.NODE_1675_length_1087_cov_200.405039~~NODE_1675_length_1087_cov_200.405039.p2  ORF type:complete len:245 (-),score=84.43 NODE_1675_length_1087_cov_200.405039:148-882(-)
MPRYKLHLAAVAGATGRMGQALTRQLLLSPLCSGVHALCRNPLALHFADLAAAEAKLKLHQIELGTAQLGVDAAELEGIDTAYCMLGSRRGWTDKEDVTCVERDGVVEFARLCEAVGVPHISLLSSAWSTRSEGAWVPPFARLHAEAADEVAAMKGFKRVSIFRPSGVVDRKHRMIIRPGATPVEKWTWRATSLATEFMPKRFRPMPLDDVVLAMRLNAELCDASERVEVLDFKDMMQVIGKDI